MKAPDPNGCHEAWCRSRLAPDVQRSQRLYEIAIGKVPDVAEDGCDCAPSRAVTVEGTIIARTSAHFSVLIGGPTGFVHSIHESALNGAERGDKVRVAVTLLGKGSDNGKG